LASTDAAAGEEDKAAAAVVMAPIINDAMQQDLNNQLDKS
jgi:hypothetical protein